MMVQADDIAPRKPLRPWPGVVIVLPQRVARFGIPILVPDFTAYGVLAGLAGASRSSSGGYSSAARPGPSASAPSP
jgi:hypothetical protein